MRKTLFKLLAVVGLSTTLMVSLVMLSSYTDLNAAVRTSSLVQRRSLTAGGSSAPFGGLGSPWEAAIDHSSCPLDKHFKVYLYNHHHAQNFHQFPQVRQQLSLFKALESRLKQKQAWAASPEDACAFLVVLRPFVQIPSHVQSVLKADVVAGFLSSLPYWSYHGTGGRNHIIVDLLESVKTAEEPLLGLTDVGNAIIVSNYMTSSSGILAPPLLQEAPRVKQTPSDEAAKSNTYANIERIFAAVNASHEYSSILPLYRKHLFYFEGSFVESLAHVRLEADSLISKIQGQALSMSQNSYIKYGNECRPSDIPSWNGEWRLCDSSEKNRLLGCKDSRFSLIFGPLGPEDPPGPTTYQRLIESLKCGSIPVVIGLNKLPFDDVIDWKKVALVFPRTLWRDALQTAAAISNDVMMQFRKQGKFLLHTYFDDPSLVFDSIVAIVRKKFLHPPPMAWDFNPTLLKRTGTVVAGIAKSHVPFATNKYENYVLNMGERLWNAAPGPHFVYPVHLNPLKSPSFRNQMEARQLPLPNSIQALQRIADEQLVQKISKMDKFTVLKQFSDLSDKINGTRLLQSGVARGAMRSFYKRSVSGSKSLSKRRSSSSPGGGGGGRYRYTKITDMFTVVTLTHHRDEQIAKLIKLLENCPFLHKMVIVWNNEYPIPSKITLPDTHIPIELVSAGQNSLNNRFLPLSNIETEAVLTLDDDIGLTCDDVELGFRIWRENQETIVGWTSRVHGKDAGGHWAYSIARVCERSMVITNAAFFHKYYSYLYSYWMPAGIREIVDQLMNCEDIAMNFLVAHISGKAPVKVGKKRSIQMENNCKEDVQSGLSCESANHFLERDFCLNAFSEYYGYVPLIYSVTRTEPLYVKSSSRTEWCDKYRDDKYSV